MACCLFVREELVAASERDTVDTRVWVSGRAGIGIASAVVALVALANKCLTGEACAKSVFLRDWVAGTSLAAELYIREFYVSIEPVFT